LYLLTPVPADLACRPSYVVWLSVYPVCVLFVSCLRVMTRVVHIPARHHVYIVQGLIRGTFTVLSPAHPLVLGALYITVLSPAHPLVLVLYLKHPVSLVL
jgi:hypothetical protein